MSTIYALCTSHISLPNYCQYNIHIHLLKPLPTLITPYKPRDSLNNLIPLTVLRVNWFSSASYMSSNRRTLQAVAAVTLSSYITHILCVCVCVCVCVSGVIDMNTIVTLPTKRREDDEVQCVHRQKCTWNIVTKRSPLSITHDVPGTKCTVDRLCEEIFTRKCTIHTTSTIGVCISTKLAIVSNRI